MQNFELEQDMAILRKKFTVLLAQGQDGGGSGAQEESLVLNRRVKELQAEVDLQKMQL